MNNIFDILQKDIASRAMLQHTPNSLLTAVTMAQGDVAKILNYKLLLRYDSSVVDALSKIYNCEPNIEIIEQILNKKLEVQLGLLMYRTGMLIFKLGFNIESTTIKGISTFKQLDIKLDRKKRI